MAALRIVQESVTNVRKHARASHCVVRIYRGSCALTVGVEDDGRGFRPDMGTGMGLDSLRIRVEELGGTLRLGRSPLGGAQVLAELPIPREEDS